MFDKIKNPIKNFWKKYNKIKKEEQPKIDDFDFFMLKYGSYIRIGENRTYVKYCKDGSFRFLVLFDADICLCFPILMLKEKPIESEEDALKRLASIEFSGELIILSSDNITKFTDVCIYAMAGHFTRDAKKGLYKNREQRYIDLIEAKKNENFQNNTIFINNDKKINRSS